jgi:hypothetical protein
MIWPAATGEHAIDCLGRGRRGEQQPEDNP